MPRPEPTIYFNIHTFGGKEYCESERLHNRAEAIREAEAWADRYQYTLTEFGRIDLRNEFSESYQAMRAYDERMDARIDSMKENA
jgi:hypothetical protein